MNKLFGIIRFSFTIFRFIDQMTCHRYNPMPFAILPNITHISSGRHFSFNNHPRHTFYSMLCPCVLLTGDQRHTGKNYKFGIRSCSSYSDHPGNCTARKDGIYYTLSSMDVCGLYGCINGTLMRLNGSSATYFKCPDGHGINPVTGLCEDGAGCPNNTVERKWIQNSGHYGGGCFVCVVSVCFPVKYSHICVTVCLLVLVYYQRQITKRN